MVVGEKAHWLNISKDRLLVQPCIIGGPRYGIADGLHFLISFTHGMYFV